MKRISTLLLALPCMATVVALSLGLLKFDNPKQEAEKPVQGVQIQRAEEKKYKIFNLGTEIKSFADMKATIEKEGYKSANYDDLLDYDNLHARDPFEKTIYAFGKGVQTPGGSFRVYSVSRDGPHRNLELHDDHGRNIPWTAHGFEFWFLGVKK